VPTRFSVAKFIEVARMLFNWLALKAPRPAILSSTVHDIFSELASFQLRQPEDAVA
jgi:hypothetical protein